MGEAGDTGEGGGELMPGPDRTAYPTFSISTVCSGDQTVNATYGVNYRYRSCFYIILTFFFSSFLDS